MGYIYIYTYTCVPSVQARAVCIYVYIYNNILLYLLHYSYADLLWNGEGFQFSEGPLYWLINYSGFFAGIKADGLNNQDYPHRSLQFASYTRNKASAPVIWKLWDDYGFQQRVLVGWWETDVKPVTIQSSDSDQFGFQAKNLTGTIQAVSFIKHNDSTVVVLASWCDQDSNVTLVYDLAALGFDQGAHLKVDIPSLHGIQPHGSSPTSIEGPFFIPANQGLVVVLTPN